ncbi:PREDICTED: uncharacterized protein LOC108381465 [Rhagoletis zephyria]|uniref:uncharacterized protein LOC108381465 n=1 Tax=Rhagoletis zephyria TaxID=28612 RepID=UPI0008117874|nr:PREDICTED: uncharacterized protein LOC108381465 [Rhagoletis zephyria]
MERAFLQKPEFYKEYCKFMDEYLELGHMREVGEYPNNIEHNSYFLPHHGVEKLSSTTTKLRVVFDGSSKYRNHRSLNEELAAGPALQCDLVQIILRWRKHNIALCSDIEKMFRQIAVNPIHQKYQQILWRKSAVDPVKIYKLLTVTYGTTPAPFLSVRTLKQLATDEAKTYPDASEVLLRDIYVDDVITGADDVVEGLYLQDQLRKLLDLSFGNGRQTLPNY